MTVSVLIPFRPSSGWRDEVAGWVVDRWSVTHPDWELVVGIDLEGGLFSSARALNDAARRATGDVLVVSCADVVPTEAFDLAVAAVKWGAAWAVPYGRTAFLSRESSVALLAATEPDDVDLDLDQMVAVCNGPTVVSRSAWARAGGFDERFQGWGPEDLAFRVALLDQVGPGVPIDGTCVHLWHERREDGETGAVEANHALFEEEYRPRLDKRIEAQLDLSPDGVEYLAMGAGRKVARPFHLRWLIPAICRRSAFRWSLLRSLSLVAACLLLGVFVLEHDGWAQAGAAVVLLAGLPGIVGIALRRPVLVDAPAFALALGAAVLVAPCWPAAVAVALVAGMAKETSPAFAAAWTGNPILLAGLIAPAARFLLSRPAASDSIRDPDARAAVEHPLTTGLAVHRPLWRDWRWILAPWGACLVGLGAPSWMLAVSLAAGYALLCITSDTVRVYQWAAPAVIVAAVTVVPAPWLLPLVVAHVFNPWRGDGS